MVIQFIVPGEPKGKGRPRLGRSGHAYTPHDTANYENLVKVCFRDTHPDFVPLDPDIPVHVAIKAYYSMPKSMTKKNRMAAAMGHLFPLKKPDVDNIMKIVCDPLNGIAYYDDAQIQWAMLSKEYGDPHVEVRMEWSDGEDE